MRKMVPFSSGWVMSNEKWVMVRVRKTQGVDGSRPGQSPEGVYYSEHGFFYCFNFLISLGVGEGDLSSEDSFTAPRKKGRKE